MKSISRRDFLKLTTNGALALSGLWGLNGIARFLTGLATEEAPTEIDLGPAADFPPGSRTLHPEIPAVILHTPSGFSAISLTCTHLGCTVSPDNHGFACPCHGSQFAPDGQVLHGPARKPLPGLEISQTEEGHLIVHLPSV